MTVTFEDLLAEMTPEQRGRIAKRTEELIEEERLHQMRAAEIAAPSRFEVYKGRDGSYRYRLVSSSGESIMKSGTAYPTEDLAREAIDIVARAIKHGDVQTAA